MTDPTSLIRCIQLMDAAERAGLEPTPLSNLHALAYLGNALAPVWGLQVDTEDAIKRDGLPFLPRFQSAFDCLVACGVIELTDFGYATDESGSWRAIAPSRLVRETAAPVLEALGEFSEERERSDLYLEIALGFSRNGEISSIFLEDASYSAPMNSVRTLIKFDPEGQANLSALVADYFSKSEPTRSFSSAEKTGLYLNHLGRLSNEAV